MVPGDCRFYVYCVNAHFHREKKISAWSSSSVRELQTWKIALKKRMSTGKFQVMKDITFLTTRTPFLTFPSDVLFEWSQSDTDNWNLLTGFNVMESLVFNWLSFFVILSGLGMRISKSSVFLNCRINWDALRDLVQFTALKKTYGGALLLVKLYASAVKYKLRVG